MTNLGCKGLAVALLLAGAASLVAGCNLEPSVAGTPTYEADVKPILESRCLRCHGNPPLQAATNGDRFELYECPADGSAGLCTKAAKDVAVTMAAYIIAPSDSITHMPPAPAAPLDPYQIDTITKWSVDPIEK